MTTVWLNHHCLFESAVVLPTFKWPGIASQLGLELQNYTTAVFFYGAADKRDALW